MDGLIVEWIVNGFVDIWRYEWREVPMNVLDGMTGRRVGGRMDTWLVLQLLQPRVRVLVYSTFGNNNIAVLKICLMTKTIGPLRLARMDLFI